MAGNSKLAHDEHVERRLQFAGDLEGHRHTAARERQHHDVVTARVGGQQAGELASPLRAIAKMHNFQGGWKARLQPTCLLCRWWPRAYDEALSSAYTTEVFR
jgi:hypothetical protein